MTSIRQFPATYPLAGLPQSRRLAAHPARRQSAGAGRGAACKRRAGRLVGALCRAGGAGRAALLIALSLLRRCATCCGKPAAARRRSLVVAAGGRGWPSASSILLAVARPRRAGAARRAPCCWRRRAAALLLGYFDLRAGAFSPALAEARLLALTARIRPHFLFNSLNAVLALIRAGPQRPRRRWRNCPTCSAC